jgi:hypothetical protein
MIKIIMKATKKERVVDRNTAHDLIDRGEAELVKEQKEETRPQVYKTRQIKARHIK